MLSAGTGVLFLGYLPLFAALPRLLTLELMDADLLWILPLLLMCSCLVALCTWAVQGPSIALRVLWTLALTFAAAGCPVAYLTAMFAYPNDGRSYSSPPPAEMPERVPSEPVPRP